MYCEQTWLLAKVQNSRLGFMIKLRTLTSSTEVNSNFYAWSFVFSVYATVGQTHSCTQVLVALAWLLNSSKLLFNYHIREENFIYQVLEYSIRRNFNKTPVNINIFLCELRTQPKLFISSRAWGLCSVKLVFKHKVSEDIKKGYMHRSIGSFDIHPSATHGHLTVVCSGGGGWGRKLKPCLAGVGN